MPGYNDIEYIQELIAKYLRVELTDIENESLQEWISTSPENKLKFEELTNTDQLLRMITFYQQAAADHDAAWQRVEDRLYVRERRASLRKLQVYAIAASVVLVAGIVAYWWLMREQDRKPLPVVVQENKAQQQDIAPGGFKAKLTLADGSTVTLNNNANGEVTKQGSIAVVNKDGGLIYRSGDTKGNGTERGLAYNTLTTARGETYAITLSDGSKVWLNSESSVHYPVTFNGNTRDVQITGEAYFEVAHDASRPFIVDAKGTVTEVLGTHFNINTYGDEHPVITTLLEGKIKIVNGESSGVNSSAILTPGQQATISSANKIIVKDHADTESAVAWMKGFFDFHNADIKNVMKQVSRWYNVDIQYAGSAVPAQAFEGNIDRNIALSELLSTLQQMGSGITYKVDGRTVKVISSK